MQLDLATGVRHQTKQEMVYHALRDAILRCELPPGQRLIIDDIAQQLRVSHIPVREALQLLQSEGLVETVPHSGASVAPISRDSVVEVFTVMEGLELVAARTAARRLTCESTDALLADLAAMDGAVRRGDREGWADLNSRFHRHIARVPNMPMLQEMTDRVFDQWDRVRRYFFTSVLDQRVERAQQEHHAIVDAMRAGDFARLERLVHQHNQGALDAYIPYLETQDDAAN
jgi:DNA-binding GntR family transcriptional regulator